MLQLAAGILLYQVRDGEPWLLLMRNRGARHWGYPKGRRDPADDHEVANARREVEEETGVTGLALHPEFRHVVAYTLRALDDPTKLVYKRVTYFLAAAPSSDFVLSEEHDDARWVAPDLALRMLALPGLVGVAEAAFGAIAELEAPP